MNSEAGRRLSIPRVLHMLPDNEALDCNDAVNRIEVRPDCESWDSDYNSTSFHP